MDIGLRNLAEDNKRATPLVGFDQPPVYPPAQFKYSQLHINVIAHLSKYLGQQTAERFEQPFRISLRDDAPVLDWNTHNIDWSDFNREHRQAGWTCAPPGCKSDTGLRPPWLTRRLGRPAFGGLHSMVCPAKIMSRSPCAPAAVPLRDPYLVPSRATSPYQSGRSRMDQHGALLHVVAAAPRPHPDRTL